VRQAASKPGPDMAEGIAAFAEKRRQRWSAPGPSPDAVDLNVLGGFGRDARTTPGSEDLATPGSPGLNTDLLLRIRTRNPSPGMAGLADHLGETYYCMMEEAEP